ncbi:peptidase [Fragilaria crotonensis]|nr:peptidase [Fragilaria crotonensis]
MKLSFASLLLFALLGLKTVVPANGQPVQPFDDGGQPFHDGVGIFDAAEEVEQDKYIIGYHNQMGLDKARSRAKAVRHNFPNYKAIATTMKPNEVEALKLDPNIAYVERDYKRHFIGLRGGGTNSVPSSPNHRRLAEVKPYGIGMVQADEVSFNTTSPIKVCIIDSGYNLGHEDLPSSGVDGMSYVDTGVWSQDTLGHGTHVAGTIVAIGKNDMGVVGVSPGVKLHIVRVFGDVDFYSSTLVAALNTCRAAGAKIVSMSLGGPDRSKTELNAFNAASKAGVLSIAAAGNEGDTSYWFPASYSSVVSVAAIDSSKTIASFSQQNDQVDLAAPGVDVLSTVPMGNGRAGSLVVAGMSYEIRAMEASAINTATGPLFICNHIDGLGSPGDCEGASNKVCVIKRGSIAFAAKVEECQSWGGLGVIIYNNVEGLFLGTLGDPSTAVIPAVSMSDTDGAALVNMAGTSATLSVVVTNYDYYDGTSMATPHVSGVAALVWSRYPACTKQNIINALFVTAMDLGTEGRDDTYGYGLIQAKAASDYLSKGCCTAKGRTCTVTLNCCSGTWQGKKKKTCK